jgi:hypothetical protein
MEDFLSRITHRSPDAGLLPVRIRNRPPGCLLVVAALRIAARDAFGS